MHDEIFRRELDSFDFIIKDGLNAYPLPDTSIQQPGIGWEEKIPPTLQQAQERLNSLLAKVNKSVEKQGGTIMGFISVPVGPEEDPSFPPSVRGPGSIRTFVVINK